MHITRDGGFTFEIDSEDMLKGLRPSEYSPRNEKFLAECTGAIGYEKTIQTIEDITNLLVDTSLITDGFPYPQIFAFTKHIIVCGETKIYELVGAALVLKLTVAAGIRWSAVDFYDGIYMSNGKVSVVRNPADGIYSLAPLSLVASTICDFKSQVMIGAPGVEWT
jgi:hypothetical protein